MNALLARDPDIARRVAIDLSDDLVSVKLVVPMMRKSRSWAARRSS
ncbi:MAG: hypothetical protein KJ626_16250 [Verrucomicrobia bacterium]|nr:hypothetical protein [Verrucomicrobiota bacterium]